jgi:hypothetical membrane protein
MTRSPSSDRRLLEAAAVAGPLFIGAALVQGAVRPGYDPMRHPVSSLSSGPKGWVQKANFVVAGALYAAGALGLARAPRGRGNPQTSAGPILIGCVGLGLIGAGIFTTDPISGYPPGSPPTQAPPSKQGRLHNLASTPVFLCLPAAATVYAHAFYRRGERGWMVFSLGAALAQLGAFVLAGAGFAQQPRFVAYGGLAQRISLASGFGWLTAVAGRVLAGSKDRVHVALV